MAAKPRINMRFNAEVLAGLEAAVKAGRAPNVTTALEEAGRAWLGMPSGVGGGTPSTPESLPPDVGTRARARPKRPAASRAKPKATGKRKSKAEVEAEGDKMAGAVAAAGRAASKAKRASAPRPKAKAKPKAASAPAAKGGAPGHRPTCGCGVCKAMRGGK